jgi:hypothetical protein
VGEPPTETTPEQLHLLAGRLVFAFQKLEHLMKSLPLMIRAEGWASEFQSTLDKRREVLSKITMGGAVASLEEAMQPQPSTEDIEEELLLRNDMHIGFYVSPDGFLDEPELAMLRDLVQERNWFVHKSLLANQPDGPTSLADLSARLEKLLVRVKECVRLFRAKAETILHARGTLLNIAKEYPGLLFPVTAADELACKLVNIAGEHGDVEGWTPLSKAEQILNSEMPDLRKESAVHLEASTLSEHIRKLGIFELRPVGPGCHACYRIKPLSPSEPSNGA